MSSRNIAVQKVVYDALAKEKRPGESFTAVLRRLLDQKEGAQELYGAWGKGSSKSSHALLRELRSAGKGGP